MIPNPNPNIADGVKADNTTYSSNKIESLIKVATELPVPEAGDAGKVLTVNDDADGYELDVIPAELPTPEAGDAGKVLTVNADSDGYELDAIIDDTASATTTAYSSDKVDDLLAGKLSSSVVTYAVLENNATVISPGYSNLCVAIVGRGRAGAFVGSNTDAQTLVACTGITATRTSADDLNYLNIANAAGSTSVVIFITM